MSSFQIFTQTQIDYLRKGGEILRGCLRHTADQVKPGMTTLELDQIAEEFIRSHPGAVPAFKGYHGFPASLCISVNDECVHGIPGKRVLSDGDIIALDGGVIFGDLYTDACISVGVGHISSEEQKFLDTTEEALEAACALVAPDTKIGDISSAIQQVVEKAGFKCVRGLTGHGLGSTLHQFPDIPNTGRAGTGPALPPNTLIAIEPITSMGKDGIKDGNDGWTILTADGSRSAHFEHTVLVTPNGHDIIA